MTRLVLAALAVLPVARPGSTACSIVGARYLARPLTIQPGDDRRYRLVIEDLPRNAFGSALFTLWRVQTVSGRTGWLLSEAHFYYACGMGRAPCVVAPKSRQDGKSPFQSEVTGLNRDFSITTGNAAPYVLLTPGFVHTDWTFAGDQLGRDLTFKTAARIPPDLGDAEVWIRERCGGG